jgi:prolyl-tRNA synthetase
LVLPPNLAPIQVVIVSIARNEEQLTEDWWKVFAIKKNWSKRVSVKYDNDDKQKPGWKFAAMKWKEFQFALLLVTDLENTWVEVVKRYATKSGIDG